MPSFEILYFAVPGWVLKLVCELHCHTAWRCASAVSSIIGRSTTLTGLPLLVHGPGFQLSPPSCREFCALWLIRDTAASLVQAHCSQDYCLQKDARHFSRENPATADSSDSCANR